MFVCLCRALTEADVACTARACLASGAATSQELFIALGLDCDEACGYCLDNPESVLSIAVDAWSECDPRSGRSSPTMSM